MSSYSLEVLTKTPQRSNVNLSNSSLINTSMLQLIMNSEQSDYLNIAVLQTYLPSMCLLQLQTKSMKHGK
jgi:hypothetical protein